MKSGLTDKSLPVQRAAAGVSYTFQDFGYLLNIGAGHYNYVLLREQPISQRRRFHNHTMRQKLRKR